MASPILGEFQWFLAGDIAKACGCSDPTVRATARRLGLEPFTEGPPYKAWTAEQAAKILAEILRRKGHQLSASKALEWRQKHGQPR